MAEAAMEDAPSATEQATAPEQTPHVPTYDNIAEVGITVTLLKTCLKDARSQQLYIPVFKVFVAVLCLSQLKLSSIVYLLNYS